MNYSIAAQYRKGRICWTYLLALTMIDHTVRTFDTDLQQLVRKIGAMGSLVERQAADAIDALLKHDAALAKITRFGRRDAARDRGYSDRDDGPALANGDRLETTRRRLPDC